VHIVEVATDRGQRGCQNRLVERSHERRQQHAKDDQQRLSMGEGLALTAGSVGIHRQACSGCELAGSGACAVALAGVVKHTRRFGQPRQEIGRMSATHAAPAVLDTAPGLLQCAKMRLRPAGGHFLAGAAAGAKLTVCSTSRHCWHGARDYIFRPNPKSLALVSSRGHTARGGPRDGA